MSEMVERVRDKLRSECLDVFGWMWSYDIAERFARAAIETMREPTIEMRKVCSFETAEVEYPAMIDAALK